MPHSSTSQTWRQTNREKSPHHPGRGPRASFVHCYILYLSDGTVFGMFPQIPNASHTYRAWSGLELKNLFVGLEIYPETSCFHKGPLFIPRNSAKNLFHWHVVNLWNFLPQRFCRCSMIEYVQGRD